MPAVPHMMRTPRTVPPDGFVIESGNVVAATGAATFAKVAPHALGCVIATRPIGAQSPVKPLNT